MLFRSVIFQLVGDGVNDGKHVPHYGNFHTTAALPGESWVTSGEVIVANFRGDTLLARRQVRLSGAGGKAFTLDYSTVGLAVAEGSYNLIARIEPVGGQADSNPANNQSVALVNARGSDPILVWTSCALNAIQSAGSQGKPGVPPTLGTRLMAMLSTAMLDTVAAFGDKVNPYRIDAKEIGRAHV